MTHFVVLVIIPREIYIKGFQSIKNYINDVMHKYSECLKVDPYIVQTKSNLEEEFEKFKNTENYDAMRYPSVKDFAQGWKGDNLNENGDVVSDFNKNSFYDWYVIGGRFDGILTGNRAYSEYGFNFGDQHHTIDNNLITVKDLLEKYEKDNDKYIFHIIIDKSGQVSKAGEYGWFGTFDKKLEEEEWKCLYVRKLKNAEDDYIVNLDCHV